MWQSSDRQSGPASSGRARPLGTAGVASGRSGGTEGEDSERPHIPLVVYQGTRTGHLVIEPDPDALWGPGLYLRESLEEARLSALTDDELLARRGPVGRAHEPAGGSGTRPGDAAPACAHDRRPASRARLLSVRLQVTSPFDMEGLVDTATGQQLLGREHDPEAHRTGAQAYEALSGCLGSKLAANEALQRAGYDCIVGTGSAPGGRRWLVFDPEKAERIGATVP